MKIAFFHELQKGGAKRVVDEYAKRLAKNHTVDLYYVDAKEDLTISSLFNKSYYFPFSGKSLGKKSWKDRLYKDTIELVHLSILHSKIAILIDKEKYDFVFVHPSKFTQAPFVLRFLKTKKVYFCQEPLRIVYDPFVSKLPNVSLLKNVYEQYNRFVRKIIDKSNISFSNLILANSTFSKKTIQQAYGKTAKVCYLGVDENIFKPLQIEKEYDVLFLGQKIAIEGYNLLEDALSFFSKKIKVKIIERNLNGEGISDQELAKEFNKAKIVVCLSRNEPFGLTVLEAMACGTPVIAVKEGGYIETVIDGETGFLIDRNPNDLYEKITLLLSNKELCKNFSEDSIQHALKNWTWDKSLERFYRVISEWQEK